MEYMIGQTRIQVERPKEVTREVLENLYDVMNRIRFKLEKKGKDVSDCFYTDAEFEKLKKSGKINLID